MPEETKYLVGQVEDKAVMRVIGRANYLNCVSVADFFTKIDESGVKLVRVDCSECTGMDSTFLGTIVAGALKFRKRGAEFRFENLNERNLELAENLGLSNIMTVTQNLGLQDNQSTNAELLSGRADAKNILNAHESLAGISKENATKFEDVLNFLRRDLGDKTK